MKCYNCGWEADIDAAFCPVCGKPKEVEPTNPIRMRTLSMLKDGLFLAICILMSVATVVSFLAGGLNIIYLLLTVFLWLVFAAAENGRLSTENMRCVSGTIYAQYVLNWVLVGICGLCTAVFALCAAVLANEPVSGEALIEELVGELELEGIYAAELIELLSALTLEVLFATVIAVFAVTTILAAVFNIFATRSMHQFAKSLYKSAIAGQLELKKLEATQNWLMVLGVLNGISAIFSLNMPISALSSAVMGIALICSSILIKKYFSVPSAEPEIEE